MQTIPDKFKERYLNITDNSNLFLQYLEKPLSRAFRVNTIKSNIEEVKKRFSEYKIKLTQVPWCKEGFIADTAKIVGTPDSFVGNIYIQETVSMIPPVLVEKELKKASLVLDACAAPGSKTTQIAALMNNKGTLIANEISYTRTKPLKFNLEKLGVLNTVITNQNFNKFPNLTFDVIFIDAPCSAEGTTRKNPKALMEWSEKSINTFSKLQKQLLLKAYELIKPGGIIIYSTCTYAPEENEEVIDYLLKNTDAQLENININGLKTCKGITEWNKKKYSTKAKKCIRIWPHLNNTGGFFIAKIKKAN